MRACSFGAVYENQRQWNTLPINEDLEEAVVPLSKHALEVTNRGELV